MNKLEILINTYNVLISVCDVELETATGLLECHVMTKKECYTAFVKELEKLRELTLNFRRFLKEMPEKNTDILINDMGEYFIGKLTDEGFIESSTRVFSKSWYVNFSWSYIPE